MSSVEDKAQVLSYQYESVFAEEDTTSITDKCHSPCPAMEQIVITEPGVLQSINIKKAIGPDLIPSCKLKDNAAIIGPVLLNIFQQSLDTGEVPDDWTKTNITSITNKGNPANYRPVSLTSVTCKLLEHIVLCSIMTHTDNMASKLGTAVTDNY